MSAVTRIGTAVLLVLGFASTSTAQDKQPAATLWIDAKQLAFIASGTAGGGVLSYQGEEHEFDIGGLGVGGFGASEIEARGKVYDLKRLADFEGVYGQARAGVVVGDASAGGLWLENPKGITIHIEGDREGLMLSVGVDGIVIDLEE